ncbi:MAG: hypothetical protein B6I20_09725 [Bacteroidetes bacterium 4572_117]|nr:MAG: hypothetical protein B6I20_09725 [Bacteroidetes bacterium 4572_117]
MKIGKSIIVLIFISFISSKIEAQRTAIDSLENLLQKHAKKDTIRVNLLNKLAYKVHLQDFDKTFKYAKEANDLAEELSFAKGKAESFRFIGIYYYLKGNYFNALEYYQKALILEEKLDNKRGIARCCNNIGMIYMYQDEYLKSLEYLQKALKLSKKSGDQIGVSLSSNNIGNTYRAMENYPDALEYYQKALKIKKKLGSKRGVAGTYHNIGKNYKFQGNYPKSLEYLQKSLKICIEIGDRSIEARNYTELGSVYLIQEKVKPAYNYSKKSYLLAKKIGELNFQKESSEILAKSCELMGRYKEAYRYSVIFKMVNDSIYNEKNTKEIAKLESRYKYEKEKELAVIKQQKKDEIYTAEKRRQKIINIFFVTGFTLIIFIAVLVYYNFLQKRKANHILAGQKSEIEEKNKELFQQNEEIQTQTIKLRTTNKKLEAANATKDKFFSIIAHDLKSPFNTIIGFADILINDFDDLENKTKKEYIRYIRQGAENTYKLLENLLLWARTQEGNINFSPEQLNFYLLINETRKTLNQFAINKSISIINNIPENIHVDADKNMLSTIMRNLISNAIKFTPKEGTVEIGVETRHGVSLHEIYVKDSGVGISKEMQSKIFDIGENTSTKGTENEKGTGLGLILCKEFIEKHGGKIWVESDIGKGSKFIFTLPAI